MLNQLKNKKIIIFGAGKIGKSLISLLKELDIRIDYIWDNNAVKCDEIENYTITKPYFQLENKDDFIVLITIYAQEISKKIYQELLENNFKNIIYEREKLNALFYDTCKDKLNQKKYLFNLNKCHLCPVSKDINHRCDIYDNFIEEELTSNKKKKKFGVTIPSMGLLVSNKCNLKCIGCNQLRDKYTTNNYLDISYEDIISDMKRISTHVDLIEKVVVVGGEAMLHKNISDILNALLNIDNIGIIQFITNGTIIPKNDEIFKLLSNHKVKVEISSYEDYISEKLNNNVINFINKLKEYKVNYDYVRTLQWFDFGDFKFRNYDEQTLSRVYDSCCFISNDLFNGQLHKCARSAFATHLSIIEDLDYVDIRNTEENLTENIKNFLQNKKPKICQYCNGTSSLVIPAGQQKESI